MKSSAKAISREGAMRDDYRLLELVKMHEAKPLPVKHYDKDEITDYNSFVSEMKYLTGVVSFNLDYLALKQNAVCEHCGK